ncbi:phage repressor protein C with HTH and peptisase S24 domain [Novosphingobium chloroacetimidivorans]|uniref:Phage repressor protein C with HTH and peptisase S24 domain n=1 Tax=Novosphingobium chloroacetimidivorans TaxID=1428314 RepID=A0A7W7KA88_9SPHN|nr:S24 family peptidase [Novosphingobium chloroacetimidivorans]MBB4859060.1 phage repressor protein C with HTH and peptisase S24 domain [Novosphingobium chloroacetimidivorans]
MELDATRSRLLALAEERRVSLSQLSRLIGKNASYLQQFVRKGSPRKLEENDRAVLARFFGVPEAELGAAQEKSFDADAWVDIPRLPLEASAGPGTSVEGEDAIGSFRFSPRWLRDQGLQPHRLSAIAVRGDSMEPTLRDGDEILVEASPGTLREGIHVVRFDGALLVKRLEVRRAGHVALLSDNGAYRPIECALGDVDVIGRVVWKSGRL